MLHGGVTGVSGGRHVVWRGHRGGKYGESVGGISPLASRSATAAIARRLRPQPTTGQVSRVDGPTASTSHGRRSTTRAATPPAARTTRTAASKRTSNRGTTKNHRTATAATTPTTNSNPAS